jgi:hypothetical protein
VALTPHTVEVSIVDNHRTGGKVKQEHIATLGSIDAHMLPSFWAGLDQATCAELRDEKWELWSARARRTCFACVGGRIWSAGD